MTTSIMIHDATGIHAGPVCHSNSNAVSICIATQEGAFDICLFNLPTEVADHLAAALHPCHSRLSEDEIRPDERRKIAERLGVQS